LLKNSQFESESASLSSQISPKFDLTDAKDAGPTKLKKMSKLTNKFNSDNYEGEQGFHAFRANSYNSQEHSTRTPLGENVIRRHSYMLVNQQPRRLSKIENNGQQSKKKSR
jgi:hypothetical protein